MTHVLDTIYIVNPSSGRSNGLNIFNQIKHLINQKYILLVTTNKADTHNLIKNIDNQKIKKIVGIGGDGTIKEILEAIKSSDKNFIFGHIPTGTGNGLAASIMFKNKLEYKVENSVIPILNNNTQEIDIASVETNNSIHHSFLAVSIGFISDLDINTETFRFLGSFRYYLGSIIGLYQMKTYNLKISYLPARVSNHSKLSLSDSIPDTWENINGEFLMVWACNVSHPSYDVFISDEINFDDGYHHLVLIRNNVSRIELLWILLDLENGNILNHPKVIHIKTKQYRIKIDSNQKGIVTVDGENIGYTDIHVNLNNKNMEIIC